MCVNIFLYLFLKILHQKFVKKIITIYKKLLFTKEFHDPKQTKFKADLHLIATQYIISQKKIQNAKYTLT